MSVFFLAALESPLCFGPCLFTMMCLREFLPFIILRVDAFHQIMVVFYNTVFPSSLLSLTGIVRDTCHIFSLYFSFLTTSLLYFHLVFSLCCILLNFCLIFLLVHLVSFWLCLICSLSYLLSFKFQLFTFFIYENFLWSFKNMLSYLYCLLFLYHV